MSEVKNYSRNNDFHEAIRGYIYIVVTREGNVLAYHIYNRNYFEEYLLMFYIKDMAENQIEKEINDKIGVLKESFSSELYSIFAGVKTNDMKAWCSQC